VAADDRVVGGTTGRPGRLPWRTTVTEDALAANLANWESRVPVHAAAYGLERYLEDPGFVSGVVRHDAPALGDLTGLRVAHLQCHIGTDTVSLARLGAEVVGLDFSPSAIAVARGLADRAGTAARFVHADVYDAVEALGGGFDLVYSTVGIVGWLPSVRRWAQVVAALLAPGGRLYLRDGHPALMTLDESRDDEQLVVTHPYFGTSEPKRWEDASSYVGEPGAIASAVHYEWQHPLSEIVQAVIDAGLVLTRLHEGDRLDWAFAPWMELDDDERYRFPAQQRQLVPTEFTVEATRPREADRRG
jgi:SAM-dependent methyltransferase